MIELILINWNKKYIDKDITDLIIIRKSSVDQTKINNPGFCVINEGKKMLPIVDLKPPNKLILFFDDHSSRNISIRKNHQFVSAGCPSDRYREIRNRSGGSF